MLRFSANLGFLWADRPLLERIDAAGRAGFRAYEFHWPYDVDARELKSRCAAHGIKILGINTPRGDARKGEFGLGALVGREREFQDQFDRTLDYALTCGARAIHVMAGVVTQDREMARAVFVGNLRYSFL